jgi:hypothetical protein
MSVVRKRKGKIKKEPCEKLSYQAYKWHRRNRRMGDYNEGQNGPWAKVERKKLQTCIKPWTVPHLAFSWTLYI